MIKCFVDESQLNQNDQLANTGHTIEFVLQKLHKHNPVFVKLLGDDKVVKVSSSSSALVFFANFIQLNFWDFRLVHMTLVKEKVIALESTRPASGLEMRNKSRTLSS